MPEEQQNLRRTDRNYVKFKMKLIKRAKKRGNSGEAERHANELLQYLGLDGVSELPIEQIITVLEDNMTDLQYTDRFNQVRRAFGTRYE